MRLPRKFRRFPAWLWRRGPWHCGAVRPSCPTLRVLPRSPGAAGQPVMRSFRTWASGKLSCYLSRHHAATLRNRALRSAESVDCATMDGRDDEMTASTDFFRVKAEGLPVAPAMAGSAARSACVAELRAVCAIAFGLCALFL